MRPGQAVANLLRPDQDALSRCVLVIDDEGGTEALEILGREPQILEVHVIAVQVDRGALHLHPDNPEREWLTRTISPSSGSKAISWLMDSGGFG